MSQPPPLSPETSRPLSGETSGLLEYDCPSCGGALSFDSRTQQMRCGHCDSAYDVDALGHVEAKRGGKVDVAWQPQGQWPADARVYVCNSCGGEIVGDATLAATSCPYCDTPVVLTDQFSGLMRPDLVIPFAVDKAKARAALKAHYVGKRLLPKVFTSENHIDEIKGLYVPFWLYDYETDANIDFRAAKIRTWSDKDYDYTETRMYRETRAGKLGFARVPVDGSSRMPDTLMESIEPFDWKRMVEFKPAYLTGYFADRYDVDAKANIPRAKERIRNSVLDAFRKTVTGYRSVKVEHSVVNFKKGAVRYALLPIWMLTTRWRGKLYTFAMNGQTGRFVGDLPVSWARYWTGFASIALIATAVAAAVIWWGFK